VNVSDLDRATRFYTGVLGLRVAARTPDVAFLTSKGAGWDLALHAAARPADAALPLGCHTIGFEVAEPVQLVDLHDALARSGARVMAVDQGDHWSLHSADPDGNRLEVYAAVSGAGRGRWGKGRVLATADLEEARASRA
jgi:catechol 2,3-dioxygenase